MSPKWAVLSYFGGISYNFHNKEKHLHFSRKKSGLIVSYQKENKFTQSIYLSKSFPNLRSLALGFCVI